MHLLTKVKWTKKDNLLNFNKWSHNKRVKKREQKEQINLFKKVALPHAKKVLDEDGVFVLEQSDLRLMLNRISFDTICHEHLEYYSIKIIKEMLENNELKIFDHEYNESNGGSSKFYICHKENYKYKITTKLKEAIDL